MKIKLALILIAFFAATSILWGFFYFRNESKPLVYENNTQEEVPVEEIIAKEDSDPVAKPDTKPVESEIEEKKSIVSKQTDLAPSDSNLEKDESKKDPVDKLNIKDSLVAWGFDTANERAIDTIILHSSYNALGGDEYDFDKLILEYKEYGVAPHYLIDRGGGIYRLVKDSNIAYHAGESKTPDGRTGVNKFSLGIELMNTEKDKYTKSQYQAANNLIAFLKTKYKIKYVLGHEQIAPGRKTDPWNIDWDKIDK